mgnify:CR=1 FL=1
MPRSLCVKRKGKRHSLRHAVSVLRILRRSIRPIRRIRLLRRIIVISGHSVCAIADGVADIIHRAGLPDGAFQLLMGPGAVVGNGLAGHRGVDAVIDAVAAVNSDLSGWAINRQGDGYTALADVPSESIANEPVLVHWYRRAVYSMARANLYERYLDSAATADAVKDAEPRNLTADDLYRDARFAIRDILGVTHVTVELI